MTEPVEEPVSEKSALDSPSRGEVGFEPEQNFGQAAGRLWLSGPAAVRAGEEHERPAGEAEEAAQNDHRSALCKEADT